MLLDVFTKGINVHSASYFTGFFLSHIVRRYVIKLIQNACFSSEDKIARRNKYLPAVILLKLCIYRVLINVLIFYVNSVIGFKLRTRQVCGKPELMKRLVRVNCNKILLEYTKNRGTAAAHCCIFGSKVNQLIFNVAYHFMPGNNGRLQLVLKQKLPLLRRFLCQHPFY